MNEFQIFFFFVLPIFIGIVGTALTEFLIWQDRRQIASELQRRGAAQQEQPPA